MRRMVPAADGVRYFEISDACAGKNLLPDVRLEYGQARLMGASTPWCFSLFDLRLAGARARWAGMPGFFLGRVAEGAGLLRTRDGTLALNAGDVIYGRLTSDLAVSCAQGLQVQGAVFGPSGSAARLASLPTVAKPSVLNAETSGMVLLSGLLRAAMENLVDLTMDAMRPLEMALVEFLATEASAQAADEKILHGSMGRNAIALRAMQVIELHLGTPGLSPRLIAKFTGISLRYLQALFAKAGETPNQYIRRRRLERACQDLTDTRYAHQSITEISLRWGFADAAYFSRVFREAYAVSPSEYRYSGTCTDTRQPRHRPARLVAFQAAA